MFFQKILMVFSFSTMIFPKNNNEFQEFKEFPRK